MSGWDALAAELDRWDRPAELWWRDDDAVSDGPALRRLLALAHEFGVPLALAVIPAQAEAGLAVALSGTGIAVLQHGFAHRNRAPPDTRKIELGARPAETVLDELIEGRRRLERLFGDAMAVVVPPWNRIDPAVAERLAPAGFIGLSALGPRGPKVAGLSVVNVHADLIDWRGSRGFAGEEAVLARLTTHLRARREGEADPAEPTGLMTHHRNHDAGCWAFLAALLAFTAGRAVRWRRAAEIFGAPLDRPGAVG